MQPESGIIEDWLLYLEPLCENNPEYSYPDIRILICGNV